ncbi:hypothetical protein [Aeromicrobium wangtongii]|uniref:hypothetical protein n=1 Tax=Aeromicrobium wangtongii TaxID=2969247 RepID=UPI0020173C23|nr:hypothetical protein [Aeromicrobium wangtongii]MCL3817254.1 hypothetical protein [Aeromicrobium wangtongii]
MDADDTSAPDAWFGVELRNLAGFDRDGARTFDERLPAVVADIRAVDRDVVCVIELPNPKIAAFSEAMEAIGYAHAAGARGRHIYVRAGIHTVGRKVLDLRPRLRNDDKQGIAVQVTPGKNAALVVVAHLEYRDRSGSTQVAQAHDLIDQGEAYATKRGIPLHRIVWALDSNSERRVRQEAFESRGYVDAFDVAQARENTQYRSFLPWGARPAEGRRIDLVAVHAVRPVHCAGLRLEPVVSDHLVLYADLGRRR